MTEEAELIARAREGDREALNGLVTKCKDLVYNLAIRMLGDPAEAEDMSQEILIRVVTGLATFRGESAFRTWVYRVASNHLLTARKRQYEQRFESFDAMGAYLDKGIASGDAPLDDQVLVREAKLTCTSMMLLCLDRDHRLAFILGEILDLSSEEAAEVLEIAPDAARKRLSRARERMAEFMSVRCGLFDERLPCRCGKQAAVATREGHLSKDALRFAPLTLRRPEAPSQGRVEEIDAIQRAVAVFRSHPEYAAPGSLVQGLKRLLEAPGSDLLG